MDVYAFWCCCAFFFGLLSAARIGDFVKIEGHLDGRFNGKIGLVTAFGHCPIVKVLLDNELTAEFAADPLDDYFLTKNFGAGNLEVLEWKTQFHDLFYTHPDEYPIPITLYEQLSYNKDTFQKHLSKDQYHLLKRLANSFNDIQEETREIYSSRGLTPELQIISVWMNQNFRTSFLKGLPDLCPLKRGALVIVERVEGEAGRFNDQMGIIVERTAQDTLVLVLSDRFHPAMRLEECFLSLRLLDHNMRLLSGHRVHSTLSQGSLASIFAHGSSNLSHDQRQQILAVKGLIASLCRNDAIILHNNYALRAKLLGAWINRHFGWYGMAYAFKCRGQDRHNGINNALDLLWDGIGAWKK